MTLEQWRPFSKLSRDSAAKILSIYASKNILEFIAESIAESRNNPRPRLAAAIISKIPGNTPMKNSAIKAQEPEVVIRYKTTSPKIARREKTITIAEYKKALDGQPPNSEYA